MLALYLNRDFVNADGIKEAKFVVAFALEIPRSEFTYINAMNKIVELNDMFNFDWIGIDRGNGDVQVEMLKQYGMANPVSGLVDKLVPIHFGEKLEVRDPHTLRVDKKELKPFMVNNSVLSFEKGKIVLAPEDENLIEQIYAYRVERVSQRGLPVYTSENEHSLDCLNMCLLVFERKYGALFKNILNSKVLTIGTLKRDKAIESRTLESEPSVINHNSSVLLYNSTRGPKRSRGHKQQFIGRSKF